MSTKKVKDPTLAFGSLTHHPIHETNEAPECDSVVLHHRINRCQEITHTLNIVKVAVVFIICQQHVFHLLQMDICTTLSEWRIGVRMRKIFSCKKRDGAICAVNILLCSADTGKLALLAF